MQQLSLAMNIETSSQKQNFQTLAQALDNASHSLASMSFFNASGHISSTCSYKELHQMALQIATLPAIQKLPRHTKVALLAETRIEFISMFFACQYAGLLPCPLAFSLSATDQETYTKKLSHLLTTCEAKLVVVPQSINSLIQTVAQVLGITVIAYEDIAAYAHTAAPPQAIIRPLKPDEPAYLQFSSGSTTAPKGILVTQQAAISNIKAILYSGLKINETDRAFSWLPFYHDMGLVGFVLAPICGHVPIDYLSPRSFARRPSLWLTLMSARRSTITYAPDFAYALAAKRLNSQDVPLDLSCVRIAGVGGDMVYAATLKNFAQKVAESGFCFSAFSPSYGLAEATLAVTMTPPEIPPFIKKFEDSAHIHELVSSGIALPDYDIKIVPLNTPQPTSLPPVGEIWIKGPSVIQPLAKKSIPPIDTQGYIPTGDIGFLYNQHLFVTGRNKDLIIIRGRNIWAQDVEWTITDAAPSIHQHHVCAIGMIDGTQEQLVILIEYHIACQEKRNQLEKQLLGIISKTFGVIAKFIWVAPHQLTLTSSGKLARAQIKEKLLTGKINSL